MFDDSKGYLTWKYLLRLLLTENNNYEIISNSRINYFNYQRQIQFNTHPIYKNFIFDIDNNTYNHYEHIPIISFLTQSYIQLFFDIS